MPPQKSIRRLEINRGERPEAPRESTMTPPLSNSRPPRGTGVPSPLTSRPRKRSRRSIWIVVVMTLGALYFVFAVVRAGVHVTIAPRQAAFTLDAEFVSLPDGLPAREDTLAHQVMTLERDARRTMPASGEEQRETKASGRIVIYNDHGTGSQRLVKNTRFRTPEGLIYRIPQSVNVPGKTTDASGAELPGSVEVEVIADAVGSDYNIGLTDFTIPGFEGTPHYENFYARSKTPMTGGFSGVVKMLPLADENAVRAELRAELETVLKAAAELELPKGFILYTGGMTVQTVPLPNEPSGDSDVTVIEKGTLSALIFDRELLARHIAARTIASFDQGAVTIPHLEQLSVSFGGTPRDDGGVPVSFTGSGFIVWSFDADALRNDLAGKSRRFVNTVLAGYSGIEKAEIVMRPFWRQSFPDNPKKITIETRTDPSSDATPLD